MNVSALYNILGIYPIAPLYVSSAISVRGELMLTEFLRKMFFDLPFF